MTSSRSSIGAMVLILIASPTLVGIPWESAATRVFDPGLRSLRGCREHRCDLPHRGSHAHH
jgi:hypothetical protein